MIYRNREKWRVQLFMNGKRISQTFTRKEDAEKFQREKEREKELIRAGLEAPRELVLVMDYARAWLQKRDGVRSASQVSNDERHLRRYILPEKGARPLTSITTGEWLDLLDGVQRDRKLANGSRNRIRATLHRMYEEAFLAGKVVQNPISRIPLLSEKKKTRKHGSWDRMEDALSYIAGCYEHSPWMGLHAVLSLFEGTREGETVALQYRDVDFRRGVLTIRRQYDRKLKAIKEWTKDKEDREVPLLPRVAAAIARHRELATFREPKDYLLAQPDGSYPSIWTIRDVHHAIIEERKLPRVTIHGLRVSFGQLAQAAGYAKEDIQKWLGHSTVQVTERYTPMALNHLLEKSRMVSFGSDCTPSAPGATSNLLTAEAV